MMAHPSSRLRGSRHASHALVFLLVCAGAPTVWAHAALKSAEPAKDAAVAAPKEVTLRFNEKLEPAFSRVKVLDPQGKPVVAASSVDASDRSVMHATLPALASGRYTVQYVAVGADGHRRAGDYGFTVK